MNHSMPGLRVHHQLPESTQTHVHWVGDAIQPSHLPLSPLLLPSIFPSIRVFSDESDLRIRWPKYWSFSFNISPSNEHPGLPSVCPKNHLLSPKGSTRLPRWLSGKEYTCQCRRQGFDPWSMKIPWRRKWQPTSAFLPGKFHGQRSLVGYSPRGRKRVRHDVETKNNEETYHSPLPSLLRCYLIQNSKSPCRFISSPGYLPCISEGYMLLNFCFPLANLSFITGVSVKNWERQREGEYFLLYISFPCLPCMASFVSSYLKTWRCWWTGKRRLGWLFNCLAITIPCFTRPCPLYSQYRQHSFSINISKNCNYHSYIQTLIQQMLNQCFPMNFLQGKISLLTR